MGVVGGVHVEHGWEFLVRQRFGNFRGI